MGRVRRRGIRPQVVGKPLTPVVGVGKFPPVVGKPPSVTRRRKERREVMKEQVWVLRRMRLEWRWKWTGEKRGRLKQ